MTVIKQRLWPAALLLMLAPLASHAVVIIDGTTTGRYNSGLGDMAAFDGPGGFFLAADVAKGIRPARPS